MRKETTGRFNEENNDPDLRSEDDGIGSTEFQDIDNCDLQVFEQVNYFDGQLLTKEDFNQDQRYFNNKRHLMNKYVIGSGVIYGLRISNCVLDMGEDAQDSVAQNAASEIAIKFELSRGVAIDDCGREIIVATSLKSTLPISKKFMEYSSQDTSETVRIGLFLKRKLQYKNIQRTYIPNSETTKNEYSSRKQENFEIIAESISNLPIVMEFDRKSYSIHEKVSIELFDPDNSLSQKTNTNQQAEQKDIGDNDQISENDHEEDVIEVNISSSTSDPEGFSLLLKKNKNKEYGHLFQGSFHLTKDQSNSDSHMLKVNYGEHITARCEIKDPYDLDSEETFNIFTNAFVSNTLTKTNEETPFLISSRDMMDDYFSFRDDSKLESRDMNYGTDNPSLYKSGVLLAIFKINRSHNDDKVPINNLELDELETSVYRKNILNHSSIFDLVKENLVSKKEYYPLINTTVITDTYKVTLSDLKPNTYIITDPIQFFPNNNGIRENNISAGYGFELSQKYPNVELEYPPIIYVGRVYENDQDDKVMYYEDIDFNVIINNKKYKPSEETKQNLIEINRHLIQSVSFKPIEITKSSFRLLITKDYDVDVAPPDSLILRWWAICKFSYQHL